MPAKRLAAALGLDRHQIESSLYHRSRVPDRLYRLLDDTKGLDVLFENC